MNELFPSVDPNTLPLRVQFAGAGLSLLLFAGLILDLFLLARLLRRPFYPADLGRQLRARPWTWREAGFVVAALACVLLLVQTITAAINWLGAVRAGEAVMALQTLFFQAAAILVIAATMRARGFTWRSAFGIAPQQVWRNVGLGCLGYVAAMPAVALYALVSMAVLKFFGYPVEKQEVIELLCDPSQPLWLRGYLVILAVVTAPVVEELLFRGVVLPAVAKRYAVLPAVILVSVAFSLIHANVAAIAPLFAFACALSLAYVFTGSMMVPIVMHTLFNGVSLVVLLMVKDVLTP
jgi:uncharacterized protein